MYYSPSTGPPNVPIALLSCAFGIFGVLRGVKVVVRRETKARWGKSGPYQIITGKNAIQMGIGIILFGLFWFVLGLASLIYLYHLHSWAAA